MRSIRFYLRPRELSSARPAFRARFCFSFFSSFAPIFSFSMPVLIFYKIYHLSSSPSLGRQGVSAAIATSICLSLGSLVVIRWSHNPGAEIILVKILSYFPAIFISSYATEASGMRQSICIPKRIHIFSRGRKIPTIKLIIRTMRMKLVPQRG